MMRDSSERGDDREGMAERLHLFPLPHDLGSILELMRCVINEGKSSYSHYLCSVDVDRGRPLRILELS